MRIHVQIYEQLFSKTWSPKLALHRKVDIWIGAERVLETSSLYTQMCTDRVIALVRLDGQVG